MTAVTELDDDTTLLIRHQRKGDERALEELAERYMPLARRLASRYRHTDEPLEDLVQVANMALLKAIKRFDPERGNAFSSYAVPTILGELKRYFRDHSWSIHVPRDLQERAAKVNKAIETLSNKEGRPPTAKEIAAKLGLDLEQVLEALQAAQAFGTNSLDAGRGESEDGTMTLGDTIGVEEEGFELVEYGAAVQDVLEAMPERTRQALHLRFVEDMTQAQIAGKIGVSQMHVSRIIRSALAELRDTVEDEEA